MKLKCVIFDLDGTIVDVSYDWDKIKVELETQGRPILYYLNSLEEPEKSEKWKILEKYEDEATKKAELKRGMHELLDLLNKKGIKKAVVTNNSRKNVVYLIAKFKLSFDYVISFRTLMHLPDWRRAISEMCRVASRAVVIDAPARLAAPGLEAAFHRMLQSFGGTAKPYRTFVRRDIERAFYENGFVVNRFERKFVLPVKIGRLLGNTRIPEQLESLFRVIGVSRILGGQMVCRAVPR